MPIGERRLFHSSQATWQALQPMQRDTSISLATSSSLPARICGGTSLEADRRTMSSVGYAGMISSGHLVSLIGRWAGRFNVAQPRLELRRLGVGISYGWSQRVGTEPFLGQAGEAPMMRDAYNVDRL